MTSPGVAASGAGAMAAAKTGAPRLEVVSGNEAIARGAREAGVRFAAAYPGTLSTEIREALAEFQGQSAGRAGQP
jgi:TPP-dependent indolepyruvate ferredoxin oxidoreductase alpha subunit